MANNIFSNPRFLHLLYPTLLVILAIAIYFTKVEKRKIQIIATSIDESTPLLESDTKAVMDEFAIWTTAYKRGSELARKNALQVAKEYERVDSLLDKTIKDFEKYLSTKPSLLRQTSLAAHFYFTKEKIKKCEDAITTYQQTVLNTIEYPGDLERFQEEIKPIALRSLSQLPADFTLLELRKAKLSIAFLESKIMYLFYIRNSGCASFSKYDVSFNITAYPSKIGDSLIGNLFVTNYYWNLWEHRNLDMDFYVNEQEIEKKENYATFKTIFPKAGLQKIEGKLNLKNKKTGEIQRINGNCSFFVNPK